MQNQTDRFNEIEEKIVRSLHISKQIAKNTKIGEEEDSTQRDAQISDLIMKVNKVENDMVQQKNQIYMVIMKIETQLKAKEQKVGFLENLFKDLHQGNSHMDSVVSLNTSTRSVSPHNS